MTTQTEEIAQVKPETPAATVMSKTIVLFGITSFLSAFLLFQVQLIVSKHILPWFGGSAAVWTTSMLVFQILLLVGYLYAHAVVTRLSARQQAVVHITLLSVSFLLVAALSFVWPSAITPGASWRPASTSHPALSVALIILLSTGIPFFALSTTGPLLQAWFGRLGQTNKTYRLYAISNVGSLLGLITFPFVMEPLFRLKTQGMMWAVLYCFFVAGCALCAAQGASVPGADPVKSDGAAGEDVYVGTASKALWFVLPACASALLLATTNLLCQEVITIPLLWVVPLAIYLLSFILCFDHPRWYKRAVFHPLFGIALFVTCIAMVYEHIPARLVSLPLLLFSACMVCHGELVRLKPGVSRLTAFYLAVSAGGAAGGIFVAVVAPSVFSTFIEFEISVGLALVLLLITLGLDAKSWIFKGEWWLPAAITGGLLVLAFGTAQWIPGLAKMLDRTRFYPLLLLVGVITGMGAFVLRQSGSHERNRFRFVQISVVLLTIAGFVGLYFTSQPKPGLVMSIRNFYGVVQILKLPGIKQMTHGRTLHGAQLDPPMDRRPITYYSPRNGVGLIMQNHPKRSTGLGNLNIGVVGLGTGTLAAYGRTGDTIRYYDINPEVIRLAAGDNPEFTFIKYSKAAVSTVLGDARLSMEQEAAAGKSNGFDVLVLDAFSGDAVPTHLLTKEAFDLYLKHLDPKSGIIVVHITSRHVNFVPVLQGAANELKAASLITFAPAKSPEIGSLWFILSKNPELLTIPGLQEISLKYVGQVGPRVWTDDYSDIFRLLY